MAFIHREYSPLCSSDQYTLYIEFRRIPISVADLHIEDFLSYTPLELLARIGMTLFRPRKALSEYFNWL